MADARGGNETLVTWLGSSTCAYPDGQRYPCNLQGVWDTELLTHRALDDTGNLARLEQHIVDVTVAAEREGRRRSPRLLEGMEPPALRTQTWQTDRGLNASARES